MRNNNKKPKRIRERQPQSAVGSSVSVEGKYAFGRGHERAVYSTAAGRIIPQQVLGHTYRRIAGLLAI